MTIEIYADGACSGNGSATAVGGWGAVLIRRTTKAGEKARKEISGRLDPNPDDPVTNNKAEMMAVIEGLEALERARLTGEQVEVFSDSGYVVNTMNEGWKRKKNKPYWNWLDAAVMAVREATGKPVRFNWVRGHSGHPENERADALAVTAAGGDR